MPSRHYRDKSFARGRMSATQAAKDIELLGQNVLEAAKAALKIGAESIANDAKSRCPVGDKKKGPGKGHPGRLRDSIRAVPTRKGTIYHIEANARDDDGFLYGQIVEFSPARGHPFLYPALDAGVPATKAAIVEAIRAACKKR